MPKTFDPVVVTASDLVEGDVIYLSGAGWVRDLSRAHVLTEEAAAARWLARAQAETGRVVGAYLAPVRRGAFGPEPAHFREAFRARGPSNYPHGKQEAPAHD